MRLSVKDKNMVAMSWLVEVFLNGLVQEKEMPESKQDDYIELVKKYQSALDIVTEINQEFSGDIYSILGQDFRDELIDLTTVLAVLYQTTPINKMLDYFKWIGQNQLIAKNSERLKEAKDEEEIQMLESDV